jgi:hypothetical protein
MADQEPLDLVIMLKIVEYVSSRKDSLGDSGAMNGDLILNIINKHGTGFQLWRRALERHD